MAFVKGARYSYLHCPSCICLLGLLRNPLYSLSKRMDMSMKHIVAIRTVFVFLCIFFEFRYDLFNVVDVQIMTRKGKPRNPTVGHGVRSRSIAVTRSFFLLTFSF